MAEAIQKTGFEVMRNRALAVTGLLLASLLAATPAAALGPGGLARGLSATITAPGAALPEVAKAATGRTCALFGPCANGRSIAVLASWVAGRDAVLPLDRLSLTDHDVERAFMAMRSEIAPLIIPAVPSAGESVDYGVLTGSVPAGQSL